MGSEKSKTALLELKKELLVVEGGEEILEQKRNILLAEIMEILERVESERKKLNEAVASSYHLMIKAYMENGRDALEQEAKLSRLKGELNVVQKSFVGIVVPEITFRLEEQTFPLNATSESLYIDLAREAFGKSIVLILELAEIEIKAWKLAEELKKTVVRVNALKKYYIPKYEKEIKTIETAIEEGEREFLSILKQLGKRREAVKGC